MKHHRMTAVLACLLLAGAASSASAAIGQSSIGNENGKLARSDRVMALDLPGINCTGLRDDKAVIAAAVTGSGVAVGKTLDMSGCLALLSSPGANGCAIDIAANTKIVGDGALRTGFTLARRYCSGGTTPGGACDADADCQGGGTCAYDLDSTGSQLAANFAPSDGSIYKAICSSAAGAGISDVRIYGNQRSMNLSIMGGNDDAYGYCDGGTSDTEVCNSRCSTGGLAGLICNTDADCAGGTCSNRQCNIDGGTCRAWNYTQHGGASGPGTIRAVDFDSASFSTIDNVVVYDVRQSDYLISTGVQGSASRLSMGYTADPNAFSQLGLPANPAVDTGVYARNSSFVQDSRISAWNHCFELRGDGGGNFNGSTAIGNTCSLQGSTSITGWPGTMGWYLSGVGNVAIGNRMASGLICGGAAPGANISTFMRNACDLVPILFLANGTHASVLDNRNAWVAQGPAIAINEHRGLCSGGSTRAGKICLRQAPTSDTGLGCPSGTCDVDTSRLADAGIGHFVFSRNFMHQSGASAWESFISIEGTKRCAGGANIYKSCSVAGDCPSSSCSSVALQNGQINDNFFYNLTAGNTAIDLTATNLATGTGVLNVQIVGNEFQGTTGTAIKMPATATQAAGNKIAANLVAGTLTLTNWDEQMGTTDWYGNTAADIYPFTKKFENRTASLAQYSVVEPSSGANDAVAQAATSTRNLIGCSMDSTSPASGATIPVAINGVSKCLVDGASTNITRGDALTMGTANAGRLKKAGAADPIFGYAQETTSSDNVAIRVLIRPRQQANGLSGFTQTLYFSGASGCGIAPGYMGPFVGSAACNATVTNVDWTVPAAMTIVGMDCSQVTDATCTVRFTVNVGGSNNTTMQCDSVNGASCSDTAGTISLSATNLLAIKVNDQNGTCTDSVGASCTLTVTQ